MGEKVSRIVIHDAYGNVTDERSLSTEERESAIADHNVNSSAHPNIQGLIETTRNEMEEKVAGVTVNGRNVVNSSKVAEVIVPMKTSDLENDNGFLNEEQVNEVTISDVQVDGRSVVEEQAGKRVVNLHKDQLGKVNDVKVNGLSILDRNNEADIIITASVDDNVGTPSVTPTMENGVINLAFSNIKGETGQTGATGRTGPQGATALYDESNPPVKVATIKTTLGDSQTDTMTQKAITDELFKATKYDKETIDFSSIDEVGRYVVNGVWVVSSGVNAARRIKLIPVTPEEKYYVENVDGISANYTVLQTNGTDAGDEPSYAEGWSWKSGAGSFFLDVPTDGAYLCLQVHNNTVAIAWNVSHILGSAFANEFGDDEYKGVSQKLFTDEVMSRAPKTEEITYLDLGVYSRYPDASGVWKSVSGSPNRQGRFIPVVGGVPVRLTAKPRNTYYVLLKDMDNLDVNAPISFAVERGTRETLQANETRIIKLPETCHYIYVTCHFENEELNSAAPKIEYLSLDDYCNSQLSETNRIMKAMMGASILQNAKIISDPEYTYAFLPQLMYLEKQIDVDGVSWKRPEPHLMAIFMGNKNETNADRTDNPNKFVLADYNLMTGEVTNTEMPSMTSYVDSEGNPLASGMKAYNAAIHLAYTEDGETDVAMVGEIGTAQSGFTNFSIGYKKHFEDTVYRQCKLAYDDGETHVVEFTVNNYRQMLYDMGWTESVILSSSVSQDLYGYYFYNETHYIAFCGYQVGGDQAALPLVLLSSTNLSTWTVEKRLGERLLNGGEIRFVIHNDVIYLINRLQFYTSSNINGDAARLDSGGYELMAFDAEGNELWYEFHQQRIKSLPMALVANGQVWLAHNVIANIYGRPSSTLYPNARQQLDFYLCDVNGPKYNFSIENVTGLNYGTTVTVPTYLGTISSDSRSASENLDRVYIAFSEDRRNLNYRQLGNVSLANITPLFVKS